MLPHSTLLQDVAPKYISQQTLQVLVGYRKIHAIKLGIMNWLPNKTAAVAINSSGQTKTSTAVHQKLNQECPITSHHTSTLVLLWFSECIESTQDKWDMRYVVLVTWDTTLGGRMGQGVQDAVVLTLDTSSASSLHTPQLENTHNQMQDECSLLVPVN